MCVRMHTVRNATFEALVGVDVVVSSTRDVIVADHVEVAVGRVDGVRVAKRNVGFDIVVLRVEGGVALCTDFVLSATYHVVIDL